MSPTLLLLSTIYIIGLLFSLIACIELVRNQGYLLPFDVVMSVICTLFSWLGFLFLIWEELTIQDDLSYFFWYYKIWEAKDGKDS